MTRTATTVILLKIMLIIIIIMSIIILKVMLIQLIHVFLVIGMGYSAGKAASVGHDGSACG